MGLLPAPVPSAGCCKSVPPSLLRTEPRRSSWHITGLRTRALPEEAFCGSGLETLCLPSDFTTSAPRLVKLQATGGSQPYEHKSHIHLRLLRGHDQFWLPSCLTQIGKEAFLSCTALQEVVIPTSRKSASFFATSTDAVWAWCPGHHCWFGPLQR